MSENFHGGNFEPDPGEVFAQLFLVHDFDRSFFAGQKVSCKFHFRETTGADSLVKFVLKIERKLTKTSLRI